MLSCAAAMFLPDLRQINDEIAHVSSDWLQVPAHHCLCSESERR